MAGSRRGSRGFSSRWSSSRWSSTRWSSRREAREASGDMDSAVVNPTLYFGQNKVGLTTAVIDRGRKSENAQSSEFESSDEQFEETDGKLLRGDEKFEAKPTFVTSQRSQRAWVNALHSSSSNSM